MSPPTGYERVSAAFFFRPRLSATLEPMPLPDALLRDLPDAAPPDPDDPIFAQRGVNMLRSWPRSHPEVARRYHADVSAPTTGAGA